MGYPPKYAKDPFPPTWSPGPNPYQVGSAAPQRGSSGVTLVIVMVVVLLVGTCLLTMVAGAIVIGVAGYRAEKARREQAREVFDEVRRQETTMNPPPVQPVYDPSDSFAPSDSFDRMRQDIDRRNEEWRRQQDEQMQQMLEDTRRRHDERMRERMERMRTSPPGRPGF